MAGRFNKIKDLFSSKGIRQVQKKDEPYERELSDREKRYREAFKRAEEAEGDKKYNPKTQKWEKLK